MYIKNLINFSYTTKFNIKNVRRKNSRTTVAGIGRSKEKHLD